MVHSEVRGEQMFSHWLAEARQDRAFDNTVFPQPLQIDAALDNLGHGTPILRGISLLAGPRRNTLFSPWLMGNSTDCQNLTTTMFAQAECHGGTWRCRRRLCPPRQTADSLPIQAHGSVPSITNTPLAAPTARCFHGGRKTWIPVGSPHPAGLATENATILWDHEPRDLAVAERGVGLTCT